MLHVKQTFSPLEKASIKLNHKNNINTKLCTNTEKIMPLKKNNNTLIQNILILQCQNTHTHTHARIKYPCWQILSQQQTIQVFVQDRALSLSLQCRGKATIKKNTSAPNVNLQPCQTIHYKQTANVLLKHEIIQIIKLKFREGKKLLIPSITSTSAL